MDQKGAIYLRTRTWIRDSHDLFDYEAKHNVIKRDFCTNVGTMIVRNNNNIYCIDQRVSEQTRVNGMEHPEYDHLLCVKPDELNNYYIIPADRPFIHNKSHFSPKKLWMVIKNLPKKRYALEENDIIKLGRFRLRVKQLIRNDHQLSNFGESSILEPESEVLTPNKAFSDRVLSGSSMTSFDPSPSQSNDRSMLDDCIEKASEEMSFESDATTDIPKQCRICLSEGDSIEDKLICACECKGSIKFVHSNCLRRWINSKWSIKNGFQNPDMVFIREVACELCKSKYPTKVVQNGKIIQIVTLPKMKPPLLVLENVTPYAVKGYHILSMANMKDLKLGRGHESDLRIPDVSISRYHATITHENDCFYLQDNDSKFGTLVAIRKPYLIKPTQSLSVQVGRSVLEMSIDKPIGVLNGVLELPISVLDSEFESAKNDDTDDLMGSVTTIIQGNIGTQVIRSVGHGNRHTLNLTNVEGDINISVNLQPNSYMYDDDNNNRQ